VVVFKIANGKYLQNNNNSEEELDSRPTRQGGRLAGVGDIPVIGSIEGARWPSDIERFLLLHGIP
jgi:hypothetical protein